MKQGLLEGRLEDEDRIWHSGERDESKVRKVAARNQSLDLRESADAHGANVITKNSAMDIEACSNLIPSFDSLESTSNTAEDALRTANIRVYNMRWQDFEKK